MRRNMPGTGPSFRTDPFLRVPRPSRVLCERAGILIFSPIPVSEKQIRLWFSRHIPRD